MISHPDVTTDLILQTATARDAPTAGMTFRRSDLGRVKDLSENPGHTPEIVLAVFLVSRCGSPSLGGQVGPRMYARATASTQSAAVQNHKID